MKIKISQLTELATSALKKYGYDDEESKVILDLLMYAQLRGNNQGLVKLIGKGLPKDPQAGKITIEKETKLSARINGQYNAGAVVLSQALNLATAKAKEHGFGIVGTHHTYSSTGALGYWAGKIASQDLIGFVFAGSPETVAMHGSYEPIFGTNPLAIGIPAEPEPIVLDMATAAMAWYGLIEAKTAGRQLPEGITYDAGGRPTTDPAAAMDGAIKAFGGHKGAALAMIVEILTGPLVAASFTGFEDSANNWGNLVMAIDPDLLVDRKDFKVKVAQLAARVKNTKKLPGVTEIMLPSERGNKLAKSRLVSGEIEIEDHLYHELQKVVN